MKVIVFGDLHLESGFHLGASDPEYGNTRMRDAEKVLHAIALAAKDADALIFAGDMAKGPRPGPLAYRLFIDAFRMLPAHVFLLRGNHDYVQGTGSCLGILARSLTPPDLMLPLGAITHPCVKKIAAADGTCALQIGFLPWSPPSRMFEQAPNDPAGLMALVAGRLTDIALELASEIDISIPSLLVGHWLAEGPFFQMPDVMRAGEPILDVTRLEAAGWGTILMGHYHEAAQLGDRSFYIGSPMRGSFGEAHLTPGYIECEWGPVTEEVSFTRTRRLELPDRPLVTLDLTEYMATVSTEQAQQPGWQPSWEVWATDRGLAGFEGTPASWEGPVVRVSYSTRPEMAAASAANAKMLIDDLYLAGALKVVGPQVTILQPERETRSDIDVSTDPLAALDRWMDQADVAEGLRDEVRAAARELTS
jgi:DNA repair exonuclease SbcCD nuclease subunit